MGASEKRALGTPGICRDYEKITRVLLQDSTGNLRNPQQGVHFSGPHKELKYFGGLHWGSLMQGNYHLNPRAYTSCSAFTIRSGPSGVIVAAPGSLGVQG